MKSRVNILVTGVGAIIGYGVIKSLRKSHYDCHIIGMDIYPDAVGQAWCDTFIQAIPAVDPDYVDFFKEQMHKFNIDLAFFGTEQEIQRLSDARSELGDLYAKLVINTPELLTLSNDKWLTHCFLQKHGFAAIPTSLDDDFDTLQKQFGLPFLFKPRKSYAGKGMAVIHSREDFLYHKNLFSQDQYMVQKLVGDAEHEYTAAVFGFGNGESLRPILLRRKLSQEGATAKAQLVELPELEALISKLTKITCPLGPTNYQFRKEGDHYLLLEINPRISSSSSIRTLLGYNEPEMCVDWFVFGQVPVQPTLRNATVVRYIEDYAFV